jgi:serine/threonine protein phosphatase PrpC
VTGGKMDCFGITDIGCVRETNQDQFLIADLRKAITIHHSSLGYDDHTELSGASRAKLFVVADGMGGHEGGARASWMAIEGIVQYLLTNLHWPIRCQPDHEAEFFRGLHASLEYSQNQIRAAAEGNPGQNRMGTTLTLAWVVWPFTYLIHVGDSRAYLFREGQLELLSHDQTLAQALIDKGLAGDDGVNVKQYANVLTSALGCCTHMEPLYTKLHLRPEDKLLICSDGLNKDFNDAQISHALAADESAEATCRRMVQAAKEAGGRDNITVVLARFLARVPEPSQVEEAHIEFDFSLSVE